MWSYYNRSDMHYVNASSNPCFFLIANEVLCILATLFQASNVEEDRNLSFKAYVSNAVGNITVHQNVSTDVDYSWFIRPHTSQSDGDVYLNNGVATAYCTGYTEPGVTLNYSICKMETKYPLNEQACLFASNKNECHECGYSSPELNLTVNKVSTSLGFTTVSCRISSSTTGTFVCIGSRKQKFGPQVIGSFTFKEPTFWTKLNITIISASAALLLCFLIMTTICVSAVWAIKRRYRRSHNYSPLLNGDNEGGGGHSHDSLSSLPVQTRPRRQSSRTQGEQDILNTFPPGITVTMDAHSEATDATARLDNLGNNDHEPSEESVHLEDDQVSSLRQNEIPELRNSPELSVLTDSIESQRSPVVFKHEAILEEKCWIPFGLQSYKVEPAGGKIFLVPGVDDTQEAIWLEVPEGAVNVPILKIRAAVIVNGPFTVPAGYKLASLVVYVYFDPRCVSKPLLLHLPTWNAEKSSSPKIVLAPHSFDHRASDNEFQFADETFQEGSAILINGHSTQFGKVIRKGDSESYYLTAYRSERASKTEMYVLVTFESCTWLKIIDDEWMKDPKNHKRMSRALPFTFSADSISVDWEKEKGPGWRAVIHEHSNKIFPKDISISSYCEAAERDFKESRRELRDAVQTGQYPPVVSCEVSFGERTGEPIYVPLVVSGLRGDFEGNEVHFKCTCYQEKALSPEFKESYAVNGPKSPTPELPVKLAVREIHQKLIQGLKFDALLLATMHEKGLLSEVQRQTIFGMLDNGKAPLKVALYFTNEVLFNWPAEVFEKQLAQLEDVLCNHSDKGNKSLAERLHAILEGSRHGNLL
jgi:hypothetical protein